MKISQSTVYVQTYHILWFCRHWKNSYLLYLYLGVSTLLVIISLDLGRKLNKNWEVGQIIYIGPSLTSLWCTTIIRETIFPSYNVKLYTIIIITYNINFNAKYLSFCVRQSYLLDAINNHYFLGHQPTVS